jgi:uncharacterized repeat protein (TIGR01451 family)
MNSRLLPFVLTGLVLAGLVRFYESPLFGQSTGQTAPAVTITQRMPPSLEPGVALPIEITVCNTGSSAAEAVTVTDFLPTGYDLVEMVPAAEQGQGTLVWRQGRLGPGESRLMKLRLNPRPTEAITKPQNVVDVSYEGRVHSVGVTTVQAPELVLKVLPVQKCFTGQLLVCHMEVLNRGSAPAQDVTMQTVLSEGLSHPMGPDLESNLGALAPGESRIVNLEAMPMRAGDLCAQVCVQARGVRALSQQIPIHADTNPLTIVVGGPKALQPQLTGLYEMTIHNEGPAPVRDVVLTVLVPQGMEFVAAGTGGHYDPHTRVVRWDVGELAAASERSIAWNGTARSSGDQTGLVRLAIGPQTVREQSWTTQVVGEVARPTNIPAQHYGN